MNLHHYAYIPKNIVLRRYKGVDIYDLKNDESFVIDEEAYSLLKLIDGKTQIKTILNHYKEEKHEEVLSAFEQLKELNIVNLREEEIFDRVNIYDARSLPHKNPFKPPYLKNLMINITERCNLTCKHCYITEKNQIDMNLKDILKLVNIFYEFQGIRLILTGGEPFLYGELKSLLKNLTHIPLQKVMLTNGVLISKQHDEVIDLLKENFFEIFVSLDGLEQSHNQFRNSESFKDTIEGIKRLLNNHIRVSINTMVHKKNYREFDEMSQLLKSLGNIKNWAIDIPTFDNSTPQHVRETYEISAEKGGEILRNYGWGVMFESGSEGGVIDYACGPNLMAVDVSGKVTKCGFFSDLSPGNIFELGLKKSWNFIQKEVNWDIHDLKCAQLECGYLEDCRGGCRYRAYCYSNDIKGVDPYKCVQYEKNRYK
ncbi:MAG: radical SAM protein [Promethearchaeota archaeon]|nr:MAG: radical SAM protein [Candidatus Lokiarchaeota archaeon]